MRSADFTISITLIILTPLRPVNWSDSGLTGCDLDTAVTSSKLRTVGHLAGGGVREVLLCLRCSVVEGLISAADAGHAGGLTA